MRLQGFFSPVWGTGNTFLQFGRYLANAPPTSHLDSATTQLLEVIRAPRSNTGLTLDQGYPGMLQRCGPRPRFIPVATSPNTDTEPTNRGPSPAPLPSPHAAEGWVHHSLTNPWPAPAAWIRFLSAHCPKGVSFYTSVFALS